ncbi:hypothetical protein D3C77_670600 [compost metagenome]
MISATGTPLKTILATMLTELLVRALVALGNAEPAPVNAINGVGETISMETSSDTLVQPYV